MIIREPAAILPLMGTSGWGKGRRKLLKTRSEPHSLIFFVLRLVGPDTVPSHTLAGCHTGWC